MTSVAALVVGLLIIVALGALLALLAGVPVIATIIGSALVALAAFYLLTNALLKRASPPKGATSDAPVLPTETDHIS